MSESTCAKCGAALPEYPGRGRPRKYCVGCASSIRSPRARKQYEARICDRCGATFRPHRYDQRFCANRCGHAWHRQKSGQRWNERRRANYHVRRARKKGARTGEAITLEAIRERDKNRCGICGGKVNGRPWPHPLSASLDHIVPLSQGGAHDLLNVQLAHLRCNVAKGVRGGGEQLRMV